MPRHIAKELTSGASYGVQLGQNLNCLIIGKLSRLLLKGREHEGKGHMAAKKQCKGDGALWLGTTRGGTPEH